MQKKTANSVRMLKSTSLVLGQNQAKWATSVVLAKSVPSYMEIVGMIDDAAVDADKDILAAAITKNETRDNLEEELFLCCSGLISIANYEKNAELAQAVKHTESSLEKMKDDQLITTGKTVLALAKANAKKLEDYGYMAADITALETLIGQFTAVQATPRSEESTRVAAKMSMNEIIRKAKELLTDQIDHQMELMRRREPEFYSAYQSARKIIDIGIRHEKKDPKKAEAQDQKEATK